MSALPQAGSDRQLAAAHAPLLSVRDLRVQFLTERGALPAVDGVSFDVDAGETLGLVGESACGKSTACQAILGLLPANGRVGGRILFDGHDLVAGGTPALAAVRGRGIAMIFQDPVASLNPVHRIGRQIGEVLTVHQGLSRTAARAEARRLLDVVGIPDAARRIDEYPHQLSGGMNQRAGIAMALASRPRLLIADEPTTALDVTIQAQILELLRSLQREFDMAIVLVTHDLGVVAETAHRVAVMYAGRIVEQARVAPLFARPAHPYTRGLLASIPPMGGGIARLSVIDGHVPSLDAVPPGCGFAPRCTHATDACRAGRPAPQSVGAQHQAACIRAPEWT